MLITLFVHAQETTIGKKTVEETKNESLDAREVLLIPFEKNMYRSDADIDIAQASGISVHELRVLFRNELQKHLEKALTGKKSSYNLLNETPSFKKDFDYINYSTAYKYELLDGEKEKEKSGTKNGQITGNAHSGNRFMNRTISNPKSIEVIHKKYGSEYFVFINQMDIGPASATNQNDIMNETFNREIKVHYTIIDKQGNEINSGIASATFPFKKKKADVIINDTFPAIAQKIIAELP
ncbi:MAG: hypothetical protein ACK4ON_04360 [Bacteroidia bacterium]